MFANPFGRHAVLNASRLFEGMEKFWRSFQKLSSEFLGKVLTRQNANVLFEIRPVKRTGSLKFTLCD
jgi:hypothetical protein